MKNLLNYALPFIIKQREGKNTNNNNSVNEKNK